MSIALTVSSKLVSYSHSYYCLFGIVFETVMHAFMWFMCSFSSCRHFCSKISHEMMMNVSTAAVSHVVYYVILSLSNTLL